MFLNSWSLSLTLCALLVLFLLILAGRTAVRVLTYWDPGSDSNRQINLEAETWLASTLVKYALGFQIMSLVIFILAADYFCQVIVGAMCATGALTANPYGVPALLVKLVGVFLYGFWIVIHQLDISVESYPLVRVKYFYLLLLLPLLVGDIILQTLYINGLKPDIITSCCAVVFAEGGSESNLLGSVSHTGMLTIFYANGLVLLALGVWLQMKWQRAVVVINGFCWGLYLAVGLVAITGVFSSYIYAMPFHRCPFCILKPEYHYFGFALYIPLFAATFFGVTAAAIEPFGRIKSLNLQVKTFQQMAVRTGLVLLLVFSILSSYHYLRFMISGGEW